MKRTKKIKLVVSLSLIPIILLLGLFLFTGDNLEILKTVFSADLTNEQIQDHLSGFGIRGQITISILAMLQVVIAVLPAEPIQVIAGVTFGLWIGVAACTVGVILGNTLIYVLYKIYGERLSEYFDKKLDVDFDKAASSKRLALVIFILYFLPAIPYGMICFFAATVRMKYPRYILITTLGAIPSVFIGVGLGHLAMASSWILSVVVFAVLLVILSLVMLKRDFFVGKVNAFLKKSDTPYSSKTVVRSYGKYKLEPLYYGFKLFILGKLKFKILAKPDKIERPSIVLCNHGAFIDFAYAGTILRRESPNFIVARLYFYKKILGNLMRSFGCFPKSMFITDTESAMNCIRVIKSGRVLAMMPEARLSTIGKFEDIQESTFSFLKKMGVTVYTIKIGGDYLAKPKWGKGIRRGSLVEARMDLLFTPEQLADMSEEQIKVRTEEALYYNEFDWLEQHPGIRYRSKCIAEGLENILSRCPNCNAHYSIKTKGSKVLCQACSLEATVDDRYNFVGLKPFRNFADWYEWQTERIREQILENENYTLSARVVLKHASTDGKTLLRVAGEGECTLTRKGLTYVGTEDGNDIEKHFPISYIYRLLFGAGEDFEIYVGKDIYYFVPEEPRCCVDFYIASKIIKDEISD